MKANDPEALILFKRLAAINRTITSSLDFEEAIGLVASFSVQLVAASSSLVFLREGGQALRVCAAQGVDPGFAARFVAPMEESFLDELRQYLGFTNLKGMAACPIMFDRNLQGILVVFRDTPLEGEEMSLLTSLADQAGISLGNAYLHQTLISREAGLRNDVQRSRQVTKDLERLLHSVATYLREPVREMIGGGNVSKAREMDSLITDLLDHGHLATAEIKLEAVDLEGAVLAALTGLGTRIKSQGAVVNVKLSAFNVLADRSALVKILGILLSDSLRAVEPNLVEVTAELRGEFVRCSVTKQGPGMGVAIVGAAIERMGGRSGMENASAWVELRSA